VCVCVCVCVYVCIRVRDDKGLNCAIREGKMAVELCSLVHILLADLHDQRLVHCCIQREREREIEKERERERDRHIYIYIMYCHIP